MNERKGRGVKDNKKRHLYLIILLDFILLRPGETVILVKDHRFDIHLSI